MSKTVSIDVREDIRRGREPFSKIMNAAAALQTGEQLLVIAPFEPVPLFGVLERQGFRQASRPVAGGDWEVRFTRVSSVSSPGAARTGAAARRDPGPAVAAAQFVKVNARGHHRRDRPT